MHLNMKPFLPLLALSAIPLVADAQTVISSQGQTYGTGTITVSQTVGEAVIGTVSNGFAVEQGFHHPQAISTAVHQQEQRPALRIFPNPFTGEVRIEGARAAATLEVLDMNGRVVVRRHVAPAAASPFLLNLAGLSAGPYLLRAIGAESGASSSYPLIKQ